MLITMFSCNLCHLLPIIHNYESREQRSKSIFLFFVAYWVNMMSTFSATKDCAFIYSKSNKNMSNFHYFPIFSEPAWRFSTSYCFRRASLEAAPHQRRFSEPAWRFSTSYCFRRASLEAAPHHWVVVGIINFLIS